MAREVVVISRHWHGPEITVSVNHEAIKLELSLEDFCRALVAEMPHPTKVWSRAGAEANVIDAMHGVLAKVKEASVYNPPAPVPEPG